MNDDILIKTESKKTVKQEKKSSEININKTPLKEMVYFPFDSYELSKDSIKDLEKIAEYLRKEELTKIIIEGHCDERGTKDYNLILGEKRALTVRNFLLDRKISKNRMRTVSLGEERPIKSGDDSKSYSKNRRAQFRIN